MSRCSLALAAAILIVAATHPVSGAMASEARAPLVDADTILSAAPAPTPAAPPSVAEVGRGVVAVGAYTALWCVQGAVLTAAFSAALSVPAIATGVGAPISSAGLGGAAAAGCGFGVVWGATLSTARWLTEQIMSFGGETPQRGIMIPTLF